MLGRLRYQQPMLQWVSFDEIESASIPSRSIYFPTQMDEGKLQRPSGQEGGLLQSHQSTILTSNAGKGT